jgi:hypothetical protein
MFSLIALLSGPKEIYTHFDFSNKLILLFEAKEKVYGLVP